MDDSPKSWDWAEEGADARVMPSKAPIDSPDHLELRVDVDSFV